jgi:enoyl-CoA hydratase
MMDAAEAERAGLVARVVPADRLIDEAIEVATAIAAQPQAAVLLIKESINRAWESPLTEGLLFERRAFHALFGTPDQREGMSAFLEKRPPVYRREPD